jgi:hypothetical protein
VASTSGETVAALLPVVVAAARTGGVETGGAVKALGTAVAVGDAANAPEGRYVKNPYRLIFSRVFLTSNGLKNFGRAFATSRFGVAGCCASAATDAPPSARQMRTAKNEFLIVILLFVGVMAKVAMTISCLSQCCKWYRPTSA